MKNLLRSIGSVSVWIFDRISEGENVGIWMIGLDLVHCNEYIVTTIIVRSDIILRWEWIFKANQSNRHTIMLSLLQNANITVKLDLKFLLLLHFLVRECKKSPCKDDSGFSKRFLNIESSTFKAFWLKTGPGVVSLRWYSSSSMVPSSWTRSVSPR